MINNNKSCIEIITGMPFGSGISINNNKSCIEMKAKTISVSDEDR